MVYFTECLRRRLAGEGRLNCLTLTRTSPRNRGFCIDNDQAQPRRVSGVGRSAGLGGRLATSTGIFSVLTQSVLVPLLHLHVERNHSHRNTVKTRQDTVSYLDLINYRITQIPLNRYLQVVPEASPLLERKGRTWH